MCDLLCAPPLMNNPIDGCSCLVIEDFTAYYDHGLDDDCTPFDDDDVRPKTINIFNFYGDIYGDINGISNGHVTNIDGCCDEDCDTPSPCPEFEGFDETCPQNPFAWAAFAITDLPEGDDSGPCQDSYDESTVAYYMEIADWRTFE